MAALNHLITELRSRIYWAAARGTRRPAQNRAHCACRWPLPRQGLWARTAPYLFGAPRWGCPWWVPPASVFGCVRCGGLRVWTRSLTRPVSRTALLSTGTPPLNRGCFAWTPTPPLSGWRTPRPGPAPVGLCVLFLAGSDGAASRVCFCAPHPSCGWFVLLLCLALSGLGSPGSCPFVGVPPPPAPFFCAPAVSGFLLFYGPGCPRPWHPCPPPASGPCCGFFSFFFPLPFPPGPLHLVFVSFLPAGFGVCFLCVCFLPACFSSFPPCSLFLLAFSAPPPLACSVGLWLPGSPCAPVFFLCVVLCCWGAVFCAVSLVVLSCCVVRVLVCCRVPVCGAVCCAMLCPDRRCPVLCRVVSCR